ncbi:MAG: hypothetical protein ACFB10_10070 [Salibacteraceae bacterium]
MDLTVTHYSTSLSEWVASPPIAANLAFDRFGVVRYHLTREPSEPDQPKRLHREYVASSLPPIAWQQDSSRPEWMATQGSMKRPNSDLLILIEFE